MGDGLYYGISNTGYPMAGYHLAQICCAMMIAQAEIAKDTFAVWGFNGPGFKIWDGPSGEHKMAIDYFLDNVPQGQSPFRPHNYTNLYNGLDTVASDMQSFEFDQAVTVVIMDGAISRESDVMQQCFSDSTQFNDKDLRQMGPVFYIFLANESMQSEMKQTVKVMDETFTKIYGKDMSGFALDFVVTVGDDGSVAGFAGTLCDIARVNSGDSDLAKDLGIDSAEDAADSKA